MSASPNRMIHVVPHDDLTEDQRRTLEADVEAALAAQAIGDLPAKDGVDIRDARIGSDAAVNVVDTDVNPTLAAAGGIQAAVNTWTWTYTGPATMDPLIDHAMRDDQNMCLWGLTDAGRQLQQVQVRNGPGTLVALLETSRLHVIDTPIGFLKTYVLFKTSGRMIIDAESFDAAGTHENVFLIKIAEPTGTVVGCK